MPLSDPTLWTDRLRQTLQRYDETLLRQVAGKLVRPRSRWPAEELIDRSLATVANPAVIDRRLQDLDRSGRRLLALIAHSRRPCWRLGSLVEMAFALGHGEGLAPVFALFEAGLLYPVTETARLKSFEQWVVQAGTAGLSVFAPPQVAARALGEDLGLPDLSVAEAPAGPVHEADGLDWLLRLAALWQQLKAAPLRRTQGGGFFKRDLDRLRQDALLSGAPADRLAEVPDPALLAVALAEAEGIARDDDGDLEAGVLPACWDEGLPRALESLYTALLGLDGWDAQQGWRPPAEAPGNPFPSAYLLALLLLARLPEGAWAPPADIEAWLREHHPYWKGEAARPSQMRPWADTFLLGVLYPLRLVQAAKSRGGEWLVRLSPVGQWLLGLSAVPPPVPAYPQTLLIQPNLEILAYRQGLTPGLIARLAHFAAWKGLGAACTLQLQPDTVYRALESGFTFETIVQTLEQHATRPTPGPVIDSLRTWAQKRDRITVYPSAVLLEFGSAEELNEALARGVPAVRLTERLALVPNEEAIDFKHFRLAGTRDYSLPPEKCVTVEADGVTLSIDVARSDLLLETELSRFAAPADRGPVNGRRQYRLTPASLAAARERGVGSKTLEEWFQKRTGGPLSAAARLLLGETLGPAQLRRHLVLHVPTEEMADGLVQWPRTRALIEERLGPTALAVAEENAAPLQEVLRQLGVTLPTPAER